MANVRHATHATRYTDQEHGLAETWMELQPMQPEDREYGLPLRLRKLATDRGEFKLSLRCNHRLVTR
jgi:hypothetical protein